MSRKLTAAEVRQERDYLVKILRGEWSVLHDSPRVVRLGSSSFAMVARAILPRSDWTDREPRDRGDLERCERAYRAAPKHLRAKMLPTLQRFRALPRLARGAS